MMNLKKNVLTHESDSIFFGILVLLLIGSITSVYSQNFGEAEVSSEFTEDAKTTSIIIQYPLDNTTLQRSTDSSGNINIVGTYSGNPSSIEARFNVGAWQVIDTNPSKGKFSGTLMNQEVGQGLLEVRFENLPRLIFSVNNIGMGDVFVVVGQSNVTGAAINFQTPNSTNQYVSTEFSTENQYFETEFSTVSLSPIWRIHQDYSVFPLVANYIIQNEGVPVGFIKTGIASSTIDLWTKNNKGFRGMIQTIDEATNGTMNISAILFFQGENNTFYVPSLPFGNYNDYKIKLAEFNSNSLNNTQAKKILIGQIGQIFDGTRCCIDEIRQAQQESWNDYKIGSGPVTYDIGPHDDGIHFMADRELQVLAERWWVSIAHNLYETENVRGPQIQNIELVTSKYLILTFDKDVLIADWNGNVGLKAKGFKISNGDHWLNDSNIVKTTVNKNEVRIILNEPISTYATLSYASGNLGNGEYTIRDASKYGLPAEPIFSYMFFYDNQNFMETYLPSPLQQLKDGIPQTHVICKNWFVLTKNISGDSVVCVTPQTQEKLLEYGWIDLEN